MLSEDADKPLLEGEVMKFKPGIRVNFIQRWAQVTKREFKYYKDRYSSAEWLAKPLGSIPLNCIEKVARVDVSVGKKKAKFPTGGYQFEVFPKKIVLDAKNELHSSKFEKRSSIDSNLPENKAEYKKFVQEKGRQLVKLQSKQSIEFPDTWTSRQKEWESGDNRLLFSVKSRDQCDKWILLLNWLVDVINQESAQQ